MPLATAPSPEELLLSQEDLLAWLPLSRATILRMEKRGLFPRRLQISPGRVAWLRADVERWLAERRAAHGDNEDTGRDQAS